MDLPKIVMLLSGKRKSGKDYLSEKLKQLLNGRCEIIRISAPLKKKYAEDNGLNYKELLSSTNYKENYREKMILWSDRIREMDPGYFCKAACEDATLTEIWIVSDVRRENDIRWFISTYGNKVKTVRINASDEIRKEREWIFTKGVDDVESECGLDDYKEWDLYISNDNSFEIDDGVKYILSLIKEQC